MALLLGVDVGTTSLKAGLFDETGHCSRLVRESYQLDMKSQAMIELDADIYWRALCKAVHRAVSTSKMASGVFAICIASQGETLVAVDSAGRPTRSAIVWLDNRATKEAETIEHLVGTEEVFSRTGQPRVLPTWPACKISWIRNNEPEVFASTSKFLLLEDYLIFRLTGQFVSDTCLQSSSMLLEINTGQWWNRMLETVGIAANRLPQLAGSGTVVGRLTPDAAAAIGLRSEAVVVTGGLDQPVGALGSGNVEPGMATETTGTALAVVATVMRPVFDPRGNVPCHIHARPGAFCLLPWGQTAGLALQWVVDNFFREGAERAEAINPYAVVDESAASVAPGADGLTVLPHFDGAAWPELNPAARAVFFGIALEHRRAHFARATMEAVAYMLRANLDLVVELAGPVTEVRSAGGGANSPLWLQIKADVLQRSIVTLECSETACLGAAMLAAVALGFHANLVQASSAMVRPRGQFEPNAEVADLYRAGYARYAELYSRVSPLFTGRD